MIFVSVGTEKFSFDRLLRTIDKGLENKEINQKVFAQIGVSKYKPQLFAYKDFIDFSEMTEFIQKANIIVTHAGVGSTILSCILHRIPIIVPRYVNLGEHLDDHQVEFAKRMEGEEKILAAYDERDIIYKIKNYNHLIGRLKSARSYSNKDSLVNYLRQICN
jgi:UDP-N-acetylglucosamine transferase subunit ALG13